MKVKICFLDNYSNLYSALNLPKSFVKKVYSAKFYNALIKKGVEYEIDINLVNRFVINPTYIGDTPRLIFDDKNLLVLSKPKNTHSHPLSYLESDNLLSYLRMVGRLPFINTESWDYSLLYRLDFETSGLIILLKNSSDYNYFRENFSTKILNKKYLAIVDGVLKNKVNYKSRLSTSGKIVRVIEDGDVNANISVEPIRNNGQKTLVEVSLKQGLRHQIRVQLSTNGFPIVGDTLYGGSSAKRVYLHCSSYSLDWYGETITFKDDSFDFLF